jgi:hypothetical protein
MELRDTLSCLTFMCTLASSTVDLNFTSTKEHFIEVQPSLCDYHHCFSRSRQSFSSILFVTVCLLLRGFSLDLIL